MREREREMRGKETQTEGSQRRIRRGIMGGIKGENGSDRGDTVRRRG